MSNLNIIVLGPPGSGKGTQAQLLAKKFNLEHIESGDVLRSLASRENDLGKKIDQIIHQKGKLVPTDLLMKIIKLKLQSLSLSQGVIFDGSPRRLVEAKLLEQLLNSLGRKINYVFFVKISAKETIKRLAIRLTCKKCDQPFILGIGIKKGQTTCPKCGGQLYQRKDDTPAGIKKRLNTYRRETMPVVNYFKRKGQLIEINGQQPINKVYQDILRSLQ